MKHLVLISGILACFPTLSHAHFIWLLVDSDGKAHAFFGEAAEPDDPDLLDRIANAKAWTVGGRGEPKALELKVGEGSLVSQLDERARQSPVILKHSYGVISRGGTPFLLNYYAKAYPFELPGTWRPVEDEERLPFEILAAREGKYTAFTATWKGKPVPNSEMVITGPGIEDKLIVNTDEAGVYRCKLPQSGVYSIRARMVDETPGMSDNKKYNAVRHYSTLTIRSAISTLSALKHEIPELPKGTTSFGGAIDGDNIYIYGGNYGTAHSYSNAGQSNDLWTLNLKSPRSWKKLATGPKLQGLAMVAHGGYLYRVGGFTAMNNDGEDNDLVSQSLVARFDLATNKWEDLPALPEARSSMDAAVVGDVLYVAGGWNMPGAKKDYIWHRTAYAMDLSADRLTWRPIAIPPFIRRALSLAAWNGKLYCIGGMKQRGGPTNDVDVYNPQTDSWSKGPKLLGSSMDGFGNSAFACGGSLYVSTVSGSVQRLSPDGAKWEFAAQVDHPRFFHRLLPWADSKLVSVGGGSMQAGGKVTEIEVLKVK